MLGYIKGKIKYINNNYIIVENSGIGYRIDVGNTLSKAELNGSIELYLYMYVRENDIRLYGFVTTEELDIFEMLLNVHGVGPKAAIQLLSHIGCPTIIRSILTNSPNGLRVPGVGEKTANKIVLDLENKLKRKGYQVNSIQFTQSIPDGIIDEAIAGLKSLGYTQYDIKKMLDHLNPDALKTIVSPSQLIKQLLSQMQ